MKKLILTVLTLFFVSYLQSQDTETQSGESFPNVNVYIKIIQHFKANELSYGDNTGYFYREGDYVLLDEHISLSEFPFSKGYSFETKDAVINAEYSTATTTYFKLEFYVYWEALSYPLTASFDIKGTEWKNTETINSSGTEYDGKYFNNGMITLKFAKSYNLLITISK